MTLRKPTAYVDVSDLPQFKPRKFYMIGQPGDGRIDQEKERLAAEAVGARVDLTHGCGGIYDSVDDAFKVCAELIRLYRQNVFVCSSETAELRARP